MRSMDNSAFSVLQPCSSGSQSSTSSILSSPDFASLWCSSPPTLVPETPVSKRNGAYASSNGSARRGRAQEQDDSDDDSDLPVTPRHPHDFQVTCCSPSEVSTPGSPLVLVGKYSLNVDRSRPVVTSPLVFTSVFQGIKVWLDMEDHARKRKEIRQLLLMHGATIVPRPVQAELFVLDFTQGTPDGLRQVPGPLLYTCCRSYDWVHKSLQAGAIAPSPLPEAHRVSPLHTLLADYESSRPRRISSMVPRRSRYIDARQSASPDEFWAPSTPKPSVSVESLETVPGTSILSSTTTQLPSTPCKSLASSPENPFFPFTSSSYNCKEARVKRRAQGHPLSPYLVKITRSESPPNVPVPSTSVKGQWSKGAYDIATAGWHLAFYARWSIDGIIRLLAKKYFHRTADGWRNIYDGATYSLVMSHHDAYIAKWEIEARENRPSNATSVTQARNRRNGDRTIMGKVDRLRLERKRERRLAEFIARNRSGPVCAIDWKAFVASRAKAAVDIPSAFMDRQKLHLECKWRYREHRARIECQALRIQRLCVNSSCDSDDGSDNDVKLDTPEFPL